LARSMARVPTLNANWSSEDGCGSERSAYAFGRQ
jgi:hypothetical protein